MIGDGMGSAYTSAYRYYTDQNNTVFDSMLVGMNSTYSQNSDITDSAAAATALASAVKTKNGYIGSTETHTKIKTVLEFAKEQGYLTALAVTATLTHATPAAFLSTQGLYRDKEAEIAADYFKENQEGKLKFDFLIGGGEKYFVEAYKDFNTTANEQDISLYRDGYNFDDIKHTPFIAFTVYGDYPPFAIDESKENRYRVAKMTKKSLELLDNKNFFLMIESSQIDWCGHINDIGCAMAEMDDFAKSVEIAKTYVDTHPNTLLIITADHSTGGLSLGKKIKKEDKNISDETRSKSYLWKKEVIHRIKASSIKISKMIRKNKDINSTFKTYTSITLNEHEYQILKNTLNKKDKKTRKAVNDIINRHANTGWTTHGHTPVDVQTFAYGKGSEKFRGHLDNTEIAKKLFEVLSTQ